MTGRDQADDGSTQSEAHCAATPPGHLSPEQSPAGSQNLSKTSEIADTTVSNPSTPKQQSTAEAKDTPTKQRRPCVLKSFKEIKVHTPSPMEPLFMYPPGSLHVV